MKHKFSLDEIPEAQMSLLGISREDFLRIPTITLNSLLNGERTSLLRLNRVKVGEQTLSLDAKLSLSRDSAGNVKMSFHPVHQELQNRYKLSPEEIEKLSASHTTSLAKTEIDATGKKTQYLYFLDHITNEIVRLNQENLRAPDVINDQQLSVNQKKQFTEGNEVQLGSGKYTIDPNTEIGLRETSGQDVQQIRFGQTRYKAQNLMVDTALILSGAGGILLLEHLLLYSLKKWQKSLNQKQLQKLNNQNNPLRTLFLDAPAKEATVEAALATKETINRKASDINLEKASNYEADPTRIIQDFKAMTSTDEITHIYDKKFEAAMEKRGQSFDKIYAIERELPKQEARAQAANKKEKAALEAKNIVGIKGQDSDSLQFPDKVRARESLKRKLNIQSKI